ncbi:hypothetical protein F2Q70_00036631 [Brassica cretica]|uniref:Uncharacterized protein n=1 Tax=Brassica cretica TaxID=69181 RepID=A0A8S9JXZ8_BRACR|nr:hypothetical protein F2Q70_00036631 [Brassica cretica]
MDRVFMGDFDFFHLPRRWAENIVPSGSSSMSDEIHGLMRVLRRGRSNWCTFDRTRIQTVFALPVRTYRAPLVEESSFLTSGSASRGRASGKSPLISIHDSDNEYVSGENQPPVSLSPGSENETVAVTRKRRRSSEGALPGPSHPRFVSEGDGSLFAAQSDQISLAVRMRSVGCRLPSLASSFEREAYAKVVVASSKELEATKREGKKDAEKIEDLTEDWRRVHLENKALTSQMVAQRARIAALEVVRDRDIRRASRIARRDITANYREVLESLKDRWASKRKEVSPEIRLQEVTANIDLLTELKDGGLTVDVELARLNVLEGD